MALPSRPYWNENLELDKEALPMAECDKLSVNVMDIWSREGSFCECDSIPTGPEKWKSFY